MLLLLVVNSIFRAANPFNISELRRLVILAFDIVLLLFTLVWITVESNFVLVDSWRHYFVQLFRRVLAMNVKTAVVLVVFLDLLTVVLLYGLKL